MQVHRRTFDGSEGEISYRVWESGSSQRIVVLVHGYAEHSGRYAHVAEALVADGAATLWLCELAL